MVGVARALARRRSIGARGIPAPMLLAVLGLSVLAVAVVADVRLGTADLSVADILRATFAPQGSGVEEAIVRHARLPRVAIAILAGAALAVSGLVFQAVSRNHLASESTLGVTAGAFFAVALTRVVDLPIVGGSQLVAAFLGGLTTVGLVLSIGASVRMSAARLVLAGVAVSLAVSAVTAVILLIWEQETQGVYFWGSGNITQHDWSGVRSAAVPVFAGVLAALALARWWDGLWLDDEIATALGQRVRRARLVGVLVATFTAAAAVSVVGPIGFVGLVIPNLMRLGGARRHVVLVPLVALWGAALLLFADVAARTIDPSVTSVPAGAMTATVGAPFFLWLARHSVRPGLSRASDLGSGAIGRARGKAVLAATVMLAGLFLFGILFGFRTFSPLVLAELVRGMDTAHPILDVRVPRLVTAALAGACLGASGVLLQSVVRNPLAAPEIVGVTAGAGAGALFLIVAVPSAPLSLLPIAAFAGGASAFAVTYVTAWRGGIHPVRLALAGVAVSALAASISTVMVVRSQLNLASVLVWLAGSTHARGWDDALAVLPFAVLIPIVWLFARHLDALTLLDDSARSIGLALERTRLAVLTVAVMLAAGAVAAVGTVGFVGLVAPHLGRFLVGSRHRWLLPMGTLIGAALLVAADGLGRVVISPREVPSGLMTALLGAPYFVLMLWRSRAQP